MLPTMEPSFPPLCRILKALCCSEYRGPMPTGVTTAIGTVQILVGLLNIGLGPGRTSMGPGDFTSLGAAYWLGAVFIVSGIFSILAARFPSSGLVGFTVFMNIAGGVFAVTAVVLYVIDLAGASFLSMCDGGGDGGDGCRAAALFAERLLMAMDVTLVVLAVVELWVSVRFAILGIRALIGQRRNLKI